MEGGPPTPARLERILVALDGSEPAEQALPYVERLTRNAPVGVTLLYVEEGPGRMGRWAAEATPGARAGRIEEVHAYLDAIASGLESSGVRVETKVRFGSPAQQISEEAEHGLVDLLVMSSHGRTGLARSAFGSVADQVVHGSAVPVLLVRSDSQGAVPQHLQGPKANRCHNCGRRSYLEVFSAEDRCSRCHYLMKSCKNCIYHNGVACLLEMPGVVDTYPGNQCPEFQFRKTRLALR
jgi:nucleotide-binding universal stress UspA family protein